MRRPSDSEGISTATTIPPVRIVRASDSTGDPAAVAAAIAAIAESLADRLDSLVLEAQDDPSFGRLKSLIAYSNDGGTFGSLASIRNEARSLAAS
jgi:hypothetical protein